MMLGLYMQGIPALFGIKTHQHCFGAFDLTRMHRADRSRQGGHAVAEIFTHSWNIV